MRKVRLQRVCACRASAPLECYCVWLGTDTSDTQTDGACHTHSAGEESMNIYSCNA